MRLQHDLKDVRRKMRAPKAGVKLSSFVLVRRSLLLGMLETPA